MPRSQDSKKKHRKCIIGACTLAVCETSELHALSPGPPPPQFFGIQNLGICPVVPHQFYFLLLLFILVGFSLASDQKDICLQPVCVFWFLLMSLIPFLSGLSDVSDVAAVKLLTPCLVQGRCSVRIFLLLKVVQTCSYTSRGSEQRALAKLENKSSLCCFSVKDVSLKQNSTSGAWRVSGSTAGPSPSLSLGKGSLAHCPPGA